VFLPDKIDCFHDVLARGKDAEACSAGRPLRSLGRLVEEDASELGVSEVAPDSPPGDAHDESMISMVVPSS
jgi:hypothetical protein